jgi:PTS system nitrogen regulatory IIA component
VFAKLVERERLGCTGLDEGIAFPHCRVSGLKKSGAALMKLLEPVDFDANDGESVDLVFGLMVPAELDATDYADINRLTQLLRDQAMRARLRHANTSNELYEALFAGQPASELQSVQSR